MLIRPASGSQAGGDSVGPDQSTLGTSSRVTTPAPTFSEELWYAMMAIPNGSLCPSLHGKHAAPRKNCTSMNQAHLPLDARLFELFADAAQDGLKRVAHLQTTGQYILTSSRWPVLSYRENGLPDFSTTDTGPLDYKSAFSQRAGEPDIPEYSSSFRRLAEYCLNDPRLTRYMSPLPYASPEAAKAIPQETQTAMFDFGVRLSVEHIVDRFIHVYGDTSYSRERLVPLYLPFERWLLQTTLHVDVAVPILFLKFDFDSLQLMEGASIERMSDEFQLARISELGYHTSVNDVVLGAASHMLVIQGFTVDNSDYMTWATIVSESAAFPLTMIDQFFTAARIGSGVDTGYAQLLLRPVDWVHTYKANLPSVDGTTIRRYPQRFENFGWLRPVQTVSAAEVRRWGDLYRKLRTDNHKQVTVASKRIDMAFLRDTDEDSIIDAVIAMESLLTASDMQETTHKLAMRVAALSKLYPEETDSATEVFRAVKRIYGYRSNIVHGSTPANKKREIKLEAEGKPPPLMIALRYLRLIMSVLLEHPEYLDGRKIDEELLLRP